MLLSVYLMFSVIDLGNIYKYNIIRRKNILSILRMLKIQNGWRKMLIKSNEQLLILLDNLLREPQNFWNEFYDKTFKKIPFFVNKPDENLVCYLEKKMIQPSKVLELGCGAGRNAIYLAKQGCSVVGVDVSDRALQLAQERVDEANINVELIGSNIFELDLQEESFDFIYDSGCFHHIAPHRRVTYIELIHTLKPELISIMS